jgi:hypothetical protein
MLQAGSERLEIAFPCKSLVRILARETAIGVGDPQMSYNVLIGLRKELVYA